MAEPRVLTKPKDKPLVKVSGLKKDYSVSHGVVSVLHRNDFEIDQDSFTIIYGPSGSGKSTLVHILAGLEPPSSGSVEIMGENIYDLTADQRAHFRAMNVGLVYQSNYWVKSLSVIENVALPLLLSGRSHSFANKEAYEVLDKMGLADLGDSRPSVLSGGEQQRVSMARALVTRPKLIFADEPTGNLDSKNGQLIMDLLLKAKKSFDCSIILVTHNMEYLPLSNQQLYIRDGNVQSHQGAFRLPSSLLSSIKTQIADIGSEGVQEDV